MEYTTHDDHPSLPGARRRAVPPPAVDPHPADVRHVVLFGAGHDSLVGCRPVAWNVLGRLLRDPGTLAACLLPDRLEWLHCRPGELAPVVADLRATGEAAAGRLGLTTPLWAASHEVLPADPPHPTAAARELLAVPWREGLVGLGEPWVLSFRRP